LTSVCIPLSGKIFSWQKISAAGRWLGFDFFPAKKSSRGEGMSMSGSEGLDRLLLPRRMRRCAGKQAEWQSPGPRQDEEMIEVWKAYTFTWTDRPNFYPRNAHGAVTVAKVNDP
jgi:hypothetical protein